VTVRLGRRYSFAASHRLHSPALSDAENRAIYGKCNNPFGHGHNYEILVTLRGGVDSVTGRVVDLAQLDRFVEARVLMDLRHRNLNEELEAFRTAVPTTENLALEVERRLREAWDESFGVAGPRLERVSIWETERNICEVSDL
jgi:6-pyruvoyltetrahydropterin/6-carboxytetrahydropterin synthase